MIISETTETADTIALPILLNNPVFALITGFDEGLGDNKATGDFIGSVVSGITRFLGSTEGSTVSEGEGEIESAAVGFKDVIGVSIAGDFSEKKEATE